MNYIIPIGPFTDVLATLAGAVMGALLGNKIPERLRTILPLTFGVISMAMGIVLIAKVNALPPVIFAMLIGSALGELLKIEHAIEGAAAKVNSKIQRFFSGSNIANSSKDVPIQNFVSILVLFSASGTGIFGAMNEGITHDTTVLISKAFLDFFTAAIFATSMGFLVSTAVIPQCIILVGLYYMGQFIMPLTTPELIADFSACGGIIMLATGFRICGIRNFPIANMLPALILVMLISHFWYILF
jgi:uncharacterized protein